MNSYPNELKVVGRCHVFIAFRVGEAIDTEALDQRRDDAFGWGGFTHSRAAPSYLTLSPPPISLKQEGVQLRLANPACEVESTVVLSVFSVGAVSVDYVIQFDSALEDLVGMSVALQNNPELIKDARDRVQQLIDEIDWAIDDCEISTSSEDFIVFDVDALAEVSGLTFVENNAWVLARILRSERSKLAEDEVAEALAAQTSYLPSDRALIDWNAAFLYGGESRDDLIVLAFANVQLLLMRALDEKLKDVLRGMNDLLDQDSSEDSLIEVAKLQIDAKLQIEAVTNVLKLIGDQYLARIYRLAGIAFDLPAWEADIAEKLSVLDSVYQKLADRTQYKRSHRLEIWILILIMIEVCLGLYEFVVKFKH